MASFGKKILSAFVEVTEEKIPVAAGEPDRQHFTKATEATTVTAVATDKFKNYFDQLFRDANLPGPDYFEFAAMTKAMTAIADEKARYSAAFAGLQVQGLSKSKLLETAAAYLSILEKDAASFNSTVDAALAEKVKAKQEEITVKQQRIGLLTREISDLQHQVQLLQLEVKENEEKIANNTGSYTTCAGQKKEEILNDMEKIKQHIN
jgi:uncharacterized protein YoxC